MLNENEIREALHASRVVPISVANPHGPLGLEQLAAAVAQLRGGHDAATGSVRRPIALRTETWRKLDQIAQGIASTSAEPLSASDVAVTIIEQFVATTPLPE